ncbi:MAG: rRNA (cytidine1402-2-O)-methyltransferase, partial [Pseudonocardiales bacterium]|nr:rRNA (cytidine1402-2-O)-methyltransferase [Pseudonocardiales bacterium]
MSLDSYPPRCHSISPARKLGGISRASRRFAAPRRGGLGELAEWAAGEVRGEITLVVAGAEPGAAEVDAVALAAEVAAREAAGQPRKEAIA